MAITKLSLTNFKSFSEQTIELGNFNLLVGANASGKSNLVNAFQFLRDIATHGLEHAISEQGGVRYLRNLNVANSRPLQFHVFVQAEDESGWMFPGNLGKSRRSLSFRSVNTQIQTIEYEFSLKFHRRGSGFRVEKDRMTIRYSSSMAGDSENEENSSINAIELVNSGGKLKILSLPERKQLSFFGPLSLRKKTLLIETPFAEMCAGTGLDWFREIGFYDFDPKLTKKSAIPIAGRLELEMDGSNLAIVLNRLLSERETKRSFLNFCRYTLPFIHNLGVERVADRSVFIKLREKYAEEKDLPAFLISDGTINILALIVALYFQESKRFSVIEEPERNVHPYLLSRVLEMFKEASASKQIFATTHNPEMVKHAGLENILLVARDREGFSQVTKPADSEQVRIFLQNDMGIEDLFLDNLLGA